MIARRIAVVLAAALAASSAARAQGSPPRRATAAAKKPAAKPAARNAATKAPGTSAPAAATPAPDRAPAARSDLAALTPAPLTAPPAPPPRAFSAPAPGRTLTGDAWRATLLVGPEMYDGATALKLRADLETDILPLAPRAMLSGVVSLGFGRWSKDETVAVLTERITTESSTNTFELVPSLRASVLAGKRMTLHADAGLGVFHARSTVETSASIPGVSVKGSDSITGAVLRFGVGGHVDVNERFRVGAEALGLNFHFADGGATSVTILAGAGYRF